MKEKEVEEEEENKDDKVNDMAQLKEYSCRTLLSR